MVFGGKAGTGKEAGTAFEPTSMCIAPGVCDESSNPSRFEIMR
jgi:hypothetical protein